MKLSTLAEWSNIVKEPTQGDSFFDLTLVNNPTLVEEVKVIPGMSDHKAVWTTLNVNAMRIKKPLPEE